MNMIKKFLLLLVITISYVKPHLIELLSWPEVVLADEDSGLRAHDNKVFLDTTVLNPIYYETYEDLIAQQQAKGLPYILAVAMSEERPPHILTAYDAHAFNRYLFQEDDVVYAHNRYLPSDKIFRDYLKREIFGPIQYFTINAPNDIHAKLLGTDYDLLENPAKKEFMQTFFKANLGDAKAQNNLGFIFLKEGNLKQAKHYFQKAAYQKLMSAQYMVGTFYLHDGDLKQAQYYLQRAANQGNVKAVKKLHAIEKKLSCESAKKETS